MKIVLAPDKFKNSLTGFEFCDAVATGLSVFKDAIEIKQLPLADGGDGTIAVVNRYLKGKKVSVEVHNPFFEPISASYLYAEASKTAFIEMAEASGVKLLQPEQLDCKNATTLGTGQLIDNALEKGATKIILGIGGSATNDCGIGMATALGYKFLDVFKKTVKPIGANLSKIKYINAKNVHSRLRAVKFQIACDVTNPLYGPNGATQVYAAQKGATLNDIKLLDKGLHDFAKVITSVFGVDPQTVKGAGAAGGMGIASKVFLNGTLKSGVELIKDFANFDAQIEGADWIITGEGQLDNQTYSGKTIQGVLQSAKTKQIKVAVFCGNITLPHKAIADLGIHYADAVMHYAKNTDDAVKNAKFYLEEMTKRFMDTIVCRDSVK